jgi:hypothetical protein
LYKTLAFESIQLVQEWQDYGTENPEEAQFIKAIGVEEFVALDWDNPWR